MAEKPQFYQDTTRVNRVVVVESKMASIVNQLITIRAEGDAIKAEINADSGSPSDMTTLGNQISNFVNHQTYGDFITYVQNALQ